MALLSKIIQKFSHPNILLVGHNVEDIYSKLLALEERSNITYLELSGHWEDKTIEVEDVVKFHETSIKNFCADLDLVNEEPNIAYLDLRMTPKKKINLLGLIFEKLPNGGVLMGNNYKNCCDLDGDNQILQMGRRYGIEVEVDEVENEWSLVKEKLSISFIIPAYNCAHTLGETLNSIITGNFEVGDQIIIVDDGSTDTTLKLAKDFQSQHTFIKLIEHPKNRGGAAARNTAVENADNPLIFCLDSDNVLEANSVCKLKNYLLRENADIASFQKLYFFKTDITEITHEWIFNAGLITFADSLASGIVPISSGNYLFSRRSWEIASGYPLFSRALDAWGFGIRQLGTGQKMVVLKDTGYFHRYGHASYWVREQSSGDTSRLALQLVAPFIGQLERDSLLYLVEPNSCNCWFENLAEKPLKLLHHPYGAGGIAVDSHGNEINPPLNRDMTEKLNILEKIKHYFRKLK